MKWLFAPASLDDIVRLLRAWRFWLLGAAAGALLGAALYQAAPPSYRARATVLVDFNLEQAWPQEIDRQLFYYLEREVRKLEEIAWSDAVIGDVAEADGRIGVGELRERRLQLSQPAEGGWRFYADDADPARASDLASAWAGAFTLQAQRDIDTESGLNALIEVTLTQAASLPLRRSVPLSAYLLSGALIAWFVGALSFLLFDFEGRRTAEVPPERRVRTPSGKRRPAK